MAKAITYHQSRFVFDKTALTNTKISNKISSKLILQMTATKCPFAFFNIEHYITGLSFNMYVYRVRFNVAIDARILTQ